MPTVTRILIYPLKSFDPIEVEESELTAVGALQHDRRFRFVKADGKTLNAKKSALVHPLEVQLDPVHRTLTARKRTEETGVSWNIDSQRQAIEHWFSEYFSAELSLEENEEGGFPDDSEATGPTVVSTETLQKVAGWFPGMSVNQARWRFRANIEISGADPFWEDRLFGTAPGVTRPFRVGDVLLAGTNPCQRCVVPTRDPQTGVVWPQFAQQFSEHREAELPVWASRDRFDHFYRLTVNTRLIDRGPGKIRVGDLVDLVEPYPL